MSTVSVSFLHGISHCSYIIRITDVYVILDYLPRCVVSPLIVFGLLLFFVSD
jgi:hypothetical protein